MFTHNKSIYSDFYRSFMYMFTLQSSTTYAFHTSRTSMRNVPLIFHAHFCITACCTFVEPEAIYACNASCVEWRADMKI